MEHHRQFVYIEHHQSGGTARADSRQRRCPARATCVPQDDTLHGLPHLPRHVWFGYGGPRIYRHHHHRLLGELRAITPDSEHRRRLPTLLYPAPEHGHQSWALGPLPLLHHRTDHHSAGHHPAFLALGAHHDGHRL